MPTAATAPLPGVEFAPNAVPPTAYNAIDPELGALISELPTAKEGYISPHQADFLYHFILLTRPRVVAETGFNAGHSAMVILRAMERYGGGTLISFDIGQHDATSEGAAIVMV